MPIKPLFRTSTLLTAALLLGACTPADPVSDTSKALATDVLLPAYDQWADSNRALAISSQAYCTGEQSLEEAQEAFYHAQYAWAGLQPLLVGPMGEGNRAWQVQFWPDKKNLVGRQVSAILKSKPELTQADLEKASVVVQGLSAYEYLLFDQAVDLNDENKRTDYCRLLQAIGAHQQRLSTDILQAWQGSEGMAQQFARFPNDHYADATEAIADVLRVQVTALDGLKKKLGAPLGRQTKGITQPFQAEGWRSDATLGSLKATLTGAQSLWIGKDGKGLRQLSTPELAGRLDAAYATTLQQLADIQPPFSKRLSEESGRQQLDALYRNIDALHRLHQNELAGALGVQIGFNAHDGD